MSFAEDNDFDSFDPFDDCDLPSENRKPYIDDNILFHPEVNQIEKEEIEPMDWIEKCLEI